MGAGDGSSHVIGGWAWALAGVAEARLGHERPARVALERAAVHMAKVEPDDPIFGVFTTEELGSFRGACHLYLADPKRAQVVLGQTAQSLGAGWEKNKAVVLGDLAKAFIYQGDPEQAAAVYTSPLIWWSGPARLPGCAGSSRPAGSSDPGAMSPSSRTCRIGCWRWGVRCRLNRAGLRERF
jgi:hypothetical protein